MGGVKLSCTNFGRHFLQSMFGTILYLIGHITAQARLDICRGHTYIASSTEDIKSIKF